MKSVKSFFTRYILEFKLSREFVLKWLALMSIYLIALLERLYPLLVNEAYIRAYDPYIQYYAAKMIEEMGLLNFLANYDPTFWYPWGKYVGAGLYLIIPLAAVIFHRFLLAIGINMDLFTAAAIMPGVLSSFVVFPIYGIGKELRNEKAGLLAAIFAALSPGLLQRNVVGFFDNESLGILFVFLTTYFFMKSLKGEKSIHWSLLAGLSLGLLTITWGLYKYLYVLLALYILLLAIIGKADRTSFSSYFITIVVAISVGALAPRNSKILTTSDTALALFVSLLALILMILYSTYEKLGREGREKLIKISLVSVAVLGILFVLLYTFRAVIPLADKFVSVVNPVLREVNPTFSSVSENQPAAWGSIFLGVYLPILFVPVGLYYFVESRDNLSIFYLLFTLTSIYFSASIARYVVVGAPVLAITAAIGIDYLLDPFSRILRGEWFETRIVTVKRALGEQRLPRGEAVIGYSLILLLLLATVNHSVWAAGGFKSYDVASYEKEAFEFLKRYATPKDIVLSWWDYGYRLSVLANVRTLADNATSNSTQMGVVGAMLMLPEEKAIDIMKRYRVKYVVVYSVDIFKAVWMIKISEKHAPEFGVREADYYSKDEGGYKEKFFKSVLWTLLAYNDQRAKSWVQQVAVDELKDKADQLLPNPPKYFRLVLDTKWDNNNQNLKIYEVIYKDIPPLYPVKNVSTTNLVSGESEYTVQKNDAAGGLALVMGVALRFILVAQRHKTVGLFHKDFLN